MRKGLKNIDKETKQLYLCKKNKDMAIYTVEIDERTSAGKGLLALLRGMNVIVDDKKRKGMDKTMEAIKEIESGGGIHCKDFEEYKKAMGR